MAAIFKIQDGGQKVSVKMATLVFVFSRVITFKKCEWLQISTNTERKYIAILTRRNSMNTKYIHTARRWRHNAQISGTTITYNSREHHFCIISNATSPDNNNATLLPACRPPSWILGLSTGIAPFDPPIPKTPNRQCHENLVIISNGSGVIVLTAALLYFLK